MYRQVFHITLWICTPLLGDEVLNNTYVSRDAQATCQLVPPFILKKRMHHFGISNPKYHCYINAVIQLLFSILRTISHDFQFNSSTEGSQSIFYLKQHIVHPVLQLWIP